MAVAAGGVAAPRAQLRCRVKWPLPGTLPRPEASSPVRIVFCRGGTCRFLGRGGAKRSLAVTGFGQQRERCSRRCQLCLDCEKEQYFRVETVRDWCWTEARTTTPDLCALPERRAPRVYRGSPGVSRCLVPPSASHSIRVQRRTPGIQRGASTDARRNSANRGNVPQRPPQYNK